MTFLSNKRLLAGIIGGLLAGAIISSLLFTYFSPSNTTMPPSGSARATDSDAPPKDSNAPLYWVAPMDPNFKRDKPGKSPMGMDLVPVYPDDEDSSSPGTVKIDPVTVQNLGVRTAKIRLENATNSINAVGQVTFDQNAISHVHARVEGWLEVLKVRTKGEYVEKGEPLYAIYSPELVNAQEELVIALNQTNSNKSSTLINAAKLRLKALGVPQSAIDDIEKTRSVAQTVTFLAPQSGVVIDINVQQGFYVKPSMTMLSIGALDSVWIIADVFASDMDSLTLGQRASITSDQLPGERFDGTLDYIYPTLSPKTRTAQARFVLDNPQQQFKPDMYASIYIQSTSANQIIIAPAQAVIRTGQSARVVLALGDGKFKSVNVGLGQLYDQGFEIIDGLMAGDEVVTSAQFLLDSESSIASDFMRMTPVNALANDELPGNTQGSDDISAWTHATVNEVLTDRDMVNITHGPLDAFRMMGMTMNFTVAEGIDLDDFSIGSDIHIEVIREETGMFQIKTVHFEEKEKSNKMEMSTHSKTNEPVIIDEPNVSAWTHATVNDIDSARRRVNLSHGYLDAFDMMGMTMDFTLADDIDVDSFEVGIEVHVEIIREPSGMFQIKTVHFADTTNSEMTEHKNGYGKHGEHH